MLHGPRSVLLLSLSVASQVACSAPAAVPGGEVDAGPNVVTPDAGPSPSPTASDAGTATAPDASTPTDALATELTIPTPHSGPTGLTRGPDGNLWVTETAAPGKIGRLTEAGVFTEFAIPTPNSAPNVIVTGPDGNLWFTEHSANQIGRITTDGTITEFPLPTASAGPMGIAAGPDGNLWFTEFAAGQVGRITPAGVVTEFATPTPNAGPFRITAAADGSLWFSEKLASAVGRVTTSGVLTEFATPTPGAGPLGISPSPSGGVVVCEHDVNQIATVTAAGVFTERRSPTAGSFPQEVLAGDDETLWFTESNVSRLGVLTAAGAFREVQVPSHYAGVSAIVSGSGGTVWFLESSANKIGRFTPPLASAPDDAQPSAPSPGTGGAVPDIVGGQLINSTTDPVPKQFPFSTVHISWDTSDNKTHLCTGVILSSTQILTAAHCQFSAGATVEYYNNKRTNPTGGFLSTIAGPPKLPLNVTGIPTAFTQFTGDGFVNDSGDYADLAVATLVNAIDSTKYPFVPIKLSPSGAYSSNYSKSSWIVGTGFMDGAVNTNNDMRYVAAIVSSDNDNGGWFQTKEEYTDLGDSGGPVFQEASDGTLLLLGTTSGFYYTNWGDRFTSVSRTSNYNWIQGLVVSP